MADIFRNRIRQSLADANLQSALDANATRRIKIRKEAFASLRNPEQLRQRAHAVRAEIIDHLEDYLEQFVSRLDENGMQVHLATDAGQAIQMVLEIAMQHGASLVAKSKTMVSEEVGLNHALEMNGLRVIETDLGEYIVQLRGEPPSHIITPAVHLRRQDVGQLFHEKLGVAYTEDIAVMTNVARQTLRQVFLDANIGLSGVNFGVAATGTLCVVTNEGNGRMVTTLPPVHIALMGIERLVPDMSDLALMLSLLPRSATGQKLSVYTSLINRPRQPTDPDGPIERHVILVDNGRRAVMASDMREILYCIRCGACLNACPVFREIGGHAYVSRTGKNSPYPGPVGSVISPALFGQLEYGHLARASSLCGVCREACPVDIDLPKLLLRIRAGTQAGRSQSTKKPNAPISLALGLKAYALVASSPQRFTAAQRLAGIFGSMLAFFSRRENWIRLPALTGWGYSKDFPRPAARPFHSRVGTLGLMNQAPMEVPNPGHLEERRGHFQDSPEVNQPQSLISIFTTELAALGGNIIECSQEELAPRILGLLHSKDIRKLLTWEQTSLPGDVLRQLSQQGIQLVHPTSESILAGSQVQAGLTGALAGIAASGSIVLIGGASRPLTASLLPGIHIAILRAEDIVGELPEALSKPEIRQAPAGVIITGPSRTADIEMALTIGVHGPGELHVFVINDSR